LGNGGKVEISTKVVEAKAQDAAMSGAEATAGGAAMSNALETAREAVRKGTR
jgi:hypothetical protein